MTEIWGEEFQDEHGITGSDAFWCVEEAVTLLMNMGSFLPITSIIRDAEFQTLLVEPLKAMGGFGEIVEEPDYLCYLALAAGIVPVVQRTMPHVTKINFLVERHRKTSPIIERFHAHLQDVFEKRPELLRLLGTFKVRGKRCIPVQAADALCWYSQRRLAGNLNRIQWRQMGMMTSRPGVLHRHKPEALRELAEHLQATKLKRRAAGLPD
jgi:hypothetical protein